MGISALGLAAPASSWRTRGWVAGYVVRAHPPAVLPLSLGPWDRLLLLRKSANYQLPNCQLPYCNCQLANSPLPLLILSIYFLACSLRPWANLLPPSRHRLPMSGSLRDVDPSPALLNWRHASCRAGSGHQSAGGGGAAFGSSLLTCSRRTSSAPRRQGPSRTPGGAAPRAAQCSCPCSCVAAGAPRCWPARLRGVVWLEGQGWRSSTPGARRIPRGDGRRLSSPTSSCDDVVVDLLYAVRTRG